MNVEALAGAYRTWFTTSARLRAEQVVDLPDLGVDAFAVLDPDFPRSYDSNRVVLPTVPDGLDLAAVVEVVDTVLAGFEHRELSVYDTVPAGWHDELLARGATAQRLVGMARHGGAPAGHPSPVEVVELDEDRVAPFVAAQWREDAPDYDDETVRQLVLRRVRMQRAGRVHRLAVVAPDGAADASAGVAAQLDLVVRGEVAELDAVGTLAPYRRRGYGDALVASALRIAATEGARTVVLEALVEDWPREWYARRGFLDVASSTGYTWRPA